VKGGGGGSENLFIGVVSDDTTVKWLGNIAIRGGTKRHLVVRGQNPKEEARRDRTKEGPHSGNAPQFKSNSDEGIPPL